MQLRHYLRILKRSWVLLVLLPLLTAGISLAISQDQPQVYTSTARVLVTHEPHPSEQTGEFPDVNLNYSWESSEFILDDLPQVVTSRAFAEDVHVWLRIQGFDISPTAIQASLDAENFHRTVTLTARAANPELATKMLDAAIEKLGSNGLRYWNRHTLERTGLSMAVLDPPGPATPLYTTRWLGINTALRAGLGLVVAVALAFLLHYLDIRLRTPRQVEEATGIEVIGVIPKE